MKLYKYASYDEYVSEQVRANKAKISKVWVEENTIEKISGKHEDPKVILCHGTRNGEEQKLFRKYCRNVETVLGTEISPTATDYEDTIQHDFHEDIPELLGKCDIIYSNAFDHSYDPELCMSVWVKHLSESGKIYLELMVGAENKSKSTDPLEISESETITLMKKFDLHLCDTFVGVFGKSVVMVFAK